MTAFLYTAFLGALVAFGYGMARVFLREELAIAAWGMAAVLGSAVFIVAVNALAYALPLFAASLTVVLVMVAVTIFCFVSKIGHAPLAVPPRFFLWTVCPIIFIAGFVFMRIPPSDMLHWSQSPLVSTMTEGNFPVMQPTNPQHRAHYHYGPELLVASIRMLTGAPTEAGYAIQPLFGIAGVLFFAAALLYLLTASWRIAALGSVLALAGGGLAWINTGFVQDLYQHFVIKDALEGPFRALWEMYKTPAANSILVIFMHRSSAMGFPLFYALLYTLYRTIRREDTLLRMRWMIVSLVIALALCLIMEIGFVVLCIALAAYAFVLLFTHGLSPKNSDGIGWGPVVRTGLLVLLPTLLIACVQGGMLTRIGPGESLGSFQFAFTGSVYPTFGQPISLFGWTVLGSFGFTLFLLPFAFMHLRRVHTWLLFITIAGVVQLAVPVFMQFYPRPGEIIRLWWGAASVCALLVGVYLSQTLLVSQRRAVRYMGNTFIVCMLVSSGIFLCMNLVFPTRHLEAAPVFARLPEMNEAEKEFYHWINTNTSLSDYFYTTATNDGDDSFEQGLFIQRSGRFSVGHTLGDTLPEDDPSLHMIADECNPRGFIAMHIRYLAITTPARAEWFRRTCDSMQWQTVYNSGTENLRVYALLPR